MRPRVLRLHPKSRDKLLRLRKEAEVEGAYRVAKRIHAVLLNAGGHTSGEIAKMLSAGRARVSEWLKNYAEHGYDGLLEGYRPGRPSSLTEEQRTGLADIIESGPVAYGYTSGVWTSPMVVRVIDEEFGVSYHPGHVRKLLHQLGFSVQRPKRKLARADPDAQDRWHRRTYPNLKKKAKAQGAALIHADEASFRQDSTLHCTWARRGCQPEIPVTGARKSAKIFGCVEIYSARFLYHRDKVFNAKTYLRFLDRVARQYYPLPVIWIQDNASYHKESSVKGWFNDNREWWTVVNLPPYSPELNATERLWHHTRITGTHNRYFDDERELTTTLTRVFTSMQRRPDQIRGYLRPFT